MKTILLLVCFVYSCFATEDAIFTARKAQEFLAHAFTAETWETEMKSVVNELVAKANANEHGDNRFLAQFHRVAVWDKTNDNRANYRELTETDGGGFIFEDAERYTGFVYGCQVIEICYTARESDKCPTRGPLEEKINHVALLQHGLFDSSNTWMMSGNGLAFSLARKGYYVFLGNSRGNMYCLAYSKTDSTSRKTAIAEWKLADVNVDDGSGPVKEEFWDFSWDEMAYNDQPSFFEAIPDILKTREVARLNDLHEVDDDGLEVVKIYVKEDIDVAIPINYVGHSQGTTQMFAALSAGWIKHSQVRRFVALAPVVGIHQTTSGALNILASLQQYISPTLLQTHFHSAQAFFHPMTFRSVVFAERSLKAKYNERGERFPVDPATKQALVHLIMDLAAGMSIFELDTEIDKYGTDFFPAGTSVADLIHWNELVNAKSFVARSQTSSGWFMSTFKHLAKVGNTTVSSAINSVVKSKGVVSTITGTIGSFWSALTTLPRVRPDRFRRRDGSTKARWRYLVFNEAIKSEPPVYNLGSENIQAAKNKIFLFYGSFDALAPPEGVKTLAGNRIINFSKPTLKGLGLHPRNVVNFPTYDHVAFTWGEHIGTEVNECVAAAFDSAGKAKALKKLLRKMKAKRYLIEMTYRIKLVIRKGESDSTPSIFETYERPIVSQVLAKIRSVEGLFGDFGHAETTCLTSLNYEANLPEGRGKETSLALCLPPTKDGVNGLSHQTILITITQTLNSGVSLENDINEILEEDN